MSAHDQSMRSNDAETFDESNFDESSVAGEMRLLAANEAYYALLADRLEALLFDMEQNDMALNNPLYLRLKGLLVEAQNLLRNARSSNESATSVLER